jgi:hypothetical protein
MDFTSTLFPGYTRAPGQTRLGYTRPQTSTNRRTSTKKVTFKSLSPSPDKKRRTSKKRSPRSQILHNVSKGFKRMSPSKLKNQRARDVAEFVQALSPALIAALSIYLYTMYEHRNVED